MQRNWNFEASRLPFASWIRRRRIRYYLTARRPMPRHVVLKAPGPASRWTLYFVFLPDGQLKPWHRHSLDALQNLDTRLMVVCATPRPEDVPDELARRCSALVWKDLPGFDFSAYAIGLDLLAQRSPGADVFVMNDSVFGPFGAIEPLLETARWDLTGFSASSQFDAHVQSFAFLLRNVTTARMRALRSVFPLHYAYDAIDPVVFCFEMRLAQVASRTMSVGSFWLGPADGTDPSIEHAFLLLDDGFPFLKRGLLGKHATRHPEAKVREALRRVGYVEG